MKKFSFYHSKTSIIISINATTEEEAREMIREQTSTLFADRLEPVEDLD